MCGTFAEKSAQQKLLPSLGWMLRCGKWLTTNCYERQKKLLKRSLFVICTYFSPITKPPKILALDYRKSVNVCRYIDCWGPSNPDKEDEKILLR